VTSTACAMDAAHVSRRHNAHLLVVVLLMVLVVSGYYLDAN
jgi:hypothetical protein